MTRGEIMKGAVIIAAASAALAVAGCASSHPADPPVNVIPANTSLLHPAAMSSAKPPVSHAATASYVLAPSHLPPGPFKVVPVYCGPFSTAQRSTFGTTARGGLIYRYTNVSNDIDGSPVVDATFLDGSMAQVDSSAGAPPAVAPGQSGEAEVDATSAGGGNVSFSTCQLNYYELLTGGQTIPEQFAP